jgi:glycosyltransferase involved in cell wall biosynthesis
MAEATGGTERTVLEVARIQQSRGHDVTIASKGDEHWQGVWENVKLLRLAPYSWAKALTFGKITGVHLPLTSLIYKEKFDLIHLHEYLKTKLFELYPKVMHFHNDPLPGCDDAAFAREAPAYWGQVGKSLRQIGVSEYLAGRLRLAHDLAGEDASDANIVRVPNGVHANAIPPQARSDVRRQAREKLGLTDSDVVFLFAGALRPEKGVEFLARAFARLSEENSAARLIMIGGGRLWIEQGWLRSDPPDTMEHRVAEILKPAIARKRALMLGIVPPAEIMPYYAASDALVLPSMFQETFGLVILEAFSVGRPVIAFRSGGIPELVEDRRNGLIVERGDEEALYQAMRELTQDHALRERLGAVGELTAQRYSWENTADQIEAVYLSALENSRRAERSARGGRNHSRATP